jgi:uncharacterized protein YjcR
VSQARGSQKLLSPDSAEWLLANERRLHALELQREKVRDIEQKRQVVEQQRLELQRGKVDVLEQKEKVRVLERQARQSNKLDDAARRRDLERQSRERKLSDTAARLEQQQVDRLAAFEKQDLREKIRERGR